MIDPPVALKSQGLRSVFPYLVESSFAAVECRAAPERTPPEREAIPADAVGKQHVGLTHLTKLTKHAGDVATSPVGFLRIAFRPQPGPRIVRGGITHKLRHQLISPAHRPHSPQRGLSSSGAT